MRTTVDIDDETLRAAKRLANARDTTLSDLVRQALRALLDAADRRRDEPFRLVEAGEAGGRFPSPSELAALDDDDELARIR